MVETLVNGCHEFNDKVLWILYSQTCTSHLNVLCLSVPISKMAQIMEQL